MPIKTFDADGVVKMYVAGHSASEVAKHFGCSKAFVYVHLRKRGIESRPRKHVQFAGDIIPAYIAGESENSIALRLGIDRKSVACALEKAGVHRRNQSEAETIKWAGMDADSRAKQVAAAHFASTQISPEERARIMEKSARMKQRTGSKIGHLEKEFFEALSARGFEVGQQVATGSYNLDLAIGDTAIEIHVNTAHPHTYPFYVRRVVNLLKRGMDVIYIKCIGKIDIDRAADQVSKLVHFAQRDKSTVRHYWMVRGSGELVACRRLDGDELAAVNALDAFQD